MSLKLYCPTGNPRGAKLLVAAELANVQVEHVHIPFEALKKEEHKQRHPLGKVPVL
jgi:glutathione S-transferase